MNLFKTSGDLPQRLCEARRKEPFLAAMSMSLAGWLCWSAAASETSPPANNPGNAEPGAGSLYIREYRVEGARQLTRIEIEEAVYPFLGPGRGKEDVEQARSALEKAFQAKGYQTVEVQVPPQQVKNGVVYLQVIEGRVGRLRVRGSRYFSAAEIKREARSLAEGKVANFNDVSRDIIALNQLPDRRVTPALKAGVEPGTVDIDLNVKDTLPLHGSLELNNRNSVGTTPLRVNGSASYNNLWQLGHSAGFSFQLAPERLDDAEIFSGYYIARFANPGWLSLMVQGTKQDSNVSTLGGADVAGRGEVLGARMIITLPAGKNYFESASIGADFKHFDQNVLLGGAQTATPITYFPVSAAYSATWIGAHSLTEVNASVTFHFRGMGSSASAFDASRFNADGGFIYLRGDLSHSQDLPAGFQVYAKAQGQAADSPLVNSEQFAGGGLQTVRGYLESEELGDNALFGSLELRTPSLAPLFGKKLNEWRFYVFGEGGVLTLKDPLPEQESRFDMASVGGGGRFQLEDHFNGSLDIGVPLISQSHTKAHNALLTFRLWADF